MPPTALACLIVVLFAAFIGIVVALQKRSLSSLEGGEKARGISEGSKRKRGAKAVAKPPRPKSEHFPRLQASLRECAKWLGSRAELREHAAKFDELSDDLAHPLMVVVMGQFNTGKSTFINCLLGERLLVSDVRPATAAVTLLTYGDKPALVAHRKDGRAEEFPFDALAEASAEGSERGAAIRRDLSHLEVRLPSPLLKRITLIDTPGLNSTNASHTEATTSFVRRADAIIWLLASGQAGTASEDADIKRLAKDMKPLVVVNQIDQIDEEEESVEDMLKRIGKRLGIETPIGISALCGLEAMENSDDDLLGRSGWKDLQNSFDNGFLSQAQGVRGERLKARVDSATSAVRLTLNDLQRNLDQNRQKAIGGETFIKSQKQMIDGLSSRRDQWRIFGQEMLEDARNAESRNLDAKYKGNLDKVEGCIPNGVPGYTQLVRQYGIFVGHKEALEKEFKGLEAEISDVTGRIESHERDLRAHERHVEEFNKKFFLVAMLSFNEQNEISTRAERLNSKSQALQAEQELTQSRLFSSMSRGARFCREVAKFGDDVIDAINKTIDGHQNNIRDHQAVSAAAQNEVDALSWLSDARVKANASESEIAIALKQDIESAQSNPTYLTTA